MLVAFNTLWKYTSRIQWWLMSFGPTGCWSWRRLRQMFSMGRAIYAQPQDVVFLTFHPFMLWGVSPRP